MISLFLNTSSKYLNAAVLKDNVVIKSIYQKFDRDLSKETLFEITKLIEDVNLKVENIDEIICVRGPGSFTGLRVGVTIAKTMAYFLNKDLYSVSSLDVLATSCKGKIIVPLIDARRDYVYGAIYDENYNILFKEQYIKLEDLIKQTKTYNKEVTFISYDEFEFNTLEVKPDLNNLFKHNFKRKENALTFVPNYLKKTEAEEKLNDKRD